MRMDSLAQILTRTNIHGMNKTVLVSSDCSGLLVGSVAERMSGSGRLLNAFPGQLHSPLTSFFNLSAEQSNVISTISFSDLHKLVSSGAYLNLGDEHVNAANEKKRNTILAAREKQKRQETEIKAVVAEGFQALIIAVERDVLNVFRALFPFLNPGQPFCVYSEMIQPLIVVHEAMKRTGAGVGLDLSETWMREYQVLPNRTHPLNQMSGASGYVLSGIKIKSEFGKSFLEEYVSQRNPVKRLKTEHAPTEVEAPMKIDS